jgi:UPF0716 family protein affecting phage T7 exclusion
MHALHHRHRSACSGDDRAAWTLVGGIALVVAGLAALVPGFRKS